MPVRSIDPRPIEDKIRAKRNRLLDECDAKLRRYESQKRLGISTVDTLGNLDAYAQALRDIPQQNGFPHSVNWPTLQG